MVKPEKLLENSINKLVVFIRHKNPAHILADANELLAEIKFWQLTRNNAPKLCPLLISLSYTQP